MDNLDYTTDSETRKKGAHLTLDERGIIKALRERGESYQAIADAVGCAKSTVHYELKRGTAKKKGGRGRKPSYQPKNGQKVYEANRKRSKRKYKSDACIDFLRWVAKKFFQEGYSLDACVGYARQHQLFPAEAMVCTKTLYNEVHRGRLSSIHLLDLPEAMRRRKKRTPRIRVHKKLMGRSIDERPAHIADKTEFGHWEIDTVIGQRDGGGAVALTLVEKSTRYYIAMKMDGKNQDATIAAMEELRKEYAAAFPMVFKTITADNGSEFARLAEIEDWKIADTNPIVYFAHPYSSSERAQNEGHNRYLRRYHPKGKPMDDVDAEIFLHISDAINSLPRKVLDYRTPEELFDEQLDRIYALN